MGRTTSNGLTSAASSRDPPTDSMAPQKVWSVETLLPCHYETAANSFDGILLDNLSHMEFEEIINKSVQKGLYEKNKNETLSHTERTSEFLNLNSVVDDTKKIGANDKDKHSLSLKDMLLGHFHESTTLSDAKLQSDKVIDRLIKDLIILDHTYALSHYTSQGVCSDSPLFGKTEDYCNQPVTCSNPKLGMDEQVLSSCMEFSKNYMGFKPLSPASSTSSLAADLASSSSYSLLSGDESDDMLMATTTSPVLPPPDQAFTSTPTLSRKREQFKTRTVTPLKRNNQEQYRFVNCTSSTNNKQVSKKSAADSHPINYSFNSEGVPPVFNSSSLDWEKSETDSEITNDSSDTRVPTTTSPDNRSKLAQQMQSLLHDHDYCSRVRFDCGPRKFTSLNVKDKNGNFKDVKRTYTKRKKISGFTEKLLKAKYLKKELLKRDSSLKPVLNHKPKLTSAALAKPSLRTVGRQRKRVFNKITDGDANPETEKKMKITGKFQDQYVYYLSKSSRTSSRRRQTTALVTSDKNLAAAPKPGDIVIPHLTEADLEAVRLGGRDALKQPTQPRCASTSVPFHSVSSFSDHSVEHLYDVDSHIVSTILSMESDSVSFPKSPHASGISTSDLNLNQPSGVNLSQPSSLNPNQPADTISTSSLNLNQPSLISTSSLNPSQPSLISTSSSNLNQPSDITTSSLNPDQPALTESLRLMSGDPTITSEHVLNYLLTLVKDDGFTDTAFASETSPTVSFPPLSDSINMADEAGQTEEVLCTEPNIEYVSSGDEFLHMMNSIEVSSSDEVLHHGAHMNSDNCFHPSQSVADTNLLDELSSMFESKEGLFPSENQHGDSGSSVKKTFTHDHSSVEIPEATSSVDKLRSIEKTIDYLYRKDDVFGNTHAEASLVTTPFPDDTPWIVTITLYFNDVPAVMINNQPYIRLVDIYKQILPAKDTGILKKRCQLMNIPILSCTEMQRHFLVQYGKACNSKSTIIVSKDHAADLIAYYTTPQSRAGRVSHHQRIQPGASRLFQKASRSGSDERGSNIPALPQRLQVTKQPGKAQYIHNDSFNCFKTSSGLYDKTNRHKKAGDLGVLKGYTNDEFSDSATTNPFDSIVKSASSQTCNEHSVKPPRKTKMKHYSEGDVSKICSFIHQRKNKKMRRTHKVGRKPGKKDVSSEREVEPPAEIFSDVDCRTDQALPQSNKLLLKCTVKKSKKCRHKKESSHHRKDISSAAPGAPLRALPVKHQSVLFDNDAESQLPPQAADLYIDLFVRPESACVRCAACHQYLSVSHFMNHHHVPSDCKLLAAAEAQRILVPLDITDMSKQDHRLWRKFQRLQKTMSSSSAGAGDGKDIEYNEINKRNILTLTKQPLSSSSSSLLHSDQSLQFRGKKRKRKSSSHLPSTSCKVESDENPESLGSKGTSSSVNSSHKHLTEAHSNLVTHDSRLTEISSPSQRTSTRKRKSKQFFSIENY